MHRISELKSSILFDHFDFKNQTGIHRLSPFEVVVVVVVVV